MALSFWYRFFSRERKMCGVSPLISTVILLGLVLAIAALVGPWAYNMARSASERKGNESVTVVQCSGAGYDFDTGWNSSGVGFNVSGTADTLTAKVVNTGYQKLWNFTFMVTVNQTSSIVLKEYTANATTQRQATSPLRPGESLLLGATVTRVRVINEACPSVYAERGV